MTTRAARPIASLALVPAIALLAVLGGLLMSPGAANADPSCKVPPSGLASAPSDAASGIVLTWDASSCTPDEYAVYRRNMDEAGSKMRLFATVDGASLGYTDTAVEAGVTYRYRIRSNNQGPRSASTELTVPAPKIDTDDTDDTDGTETSEATTRDHAPDSNRDAEFLGPRSITLSAPENTDLTGGVGDALPGFDRDGHSLHYSLSGTDASSFTVGERDGQIRTTLVFDFETKSSYSMVAHVRDPWDRGGHFDDRIDDSIGVVIAISNEDDPGVLLISGTPTNGERLIASLSDEDGNHRDRIWQWWRETFLDLFIPITGATSGSYRLVDDDLDHLILVTVSYTDDHGTGKSANARTTPVAPRNAPPVFTVSDATRTLFENLAAGTLLGSPLVATDPEGDTLIYSLGRSDSSLFLPFKIDQNGQIRAKNRFDYEAKSSYSFDAQVRDGLDGAGNDDEAVDHAIKVTVTIRNEDEPGELLISGRTVIGQQLTASLSDPDGNPRIERWLWQREHSPGIWITIGQDSSTYTLVNADLAKQLAVTPYYTDDHGAGKFVTVTIDGVTRQNAAPQFTVSEATFTVSENLGQGTLVGLPLVATDREGDTLTYSLRQGDAASFDIDQNGQITTKVNFFDYERRNSYSFKARVQDGVDSAGNDDEDEEADASITVTVDIVNEDEPGNLRISGTLQRGARLTASLSDEDNPRDVAWQWERWSTVLLDFSPIRGARSADRILARLDVGKRLRASVSYNDGFGPDKSLAAETGQITGGNVEPRFSSNRTTRALVENTPAETHVGDPVAATPGDADPLTYSLSGPDVSSFRIDSSNGQLKTKAGIDYDFDVKSSYSVDVRVRDGFDAQGDVSTATDDTITVTINVTNVNDPPSIVSGARNLTVRENHGSTTQTYTANDPDAGATLSWSLGGVDSGAFSVSTFTSTTNPEGQGVIRFLEPPDYELPTDDDRDNVYLLTLTVTDNGNPPGTDTWDITVTVTNVDEAGTVTITGTPSGGEQLTATVADEDGTVSSLTWQWSRQAPLGLFIPITGATSDSYTPVAADVARYLQVTASYSDGLGPIETASAVTSSVVGASNAEPTFDEGASATRTVAENSTAGTNAGNAVMATDSDNDTLTYSLSGAAASSFTIDPSNGQIRTVSGVDYDFEIKSSYNVTVNVHDGKDIASVFDDTIDDTIEVTVRLENVDEPGTVEIRLLTHNSGRLSVARREVMDPDGSVNTTWTKWSRGDTASGPFTELVAWRNVAEYPTVVADVGKYIELSIRYRDGEGTGKTVSAVTADPIPVTNSDPMFDPGAPTTLSVAENSTAGTSVGAALTASDSNDDTLKYSLSGPDAGSFEIDQAGQIKTRSGITYNFESAKNTYNVTVNVRDRKDIASVVDTTIDDTIDVAISLIDANDAPTITGGAPARSILEGTTVVGVYTASDEDASDTLTWDVESADDGAFFQISSSGELSFKIAPDFEDKQDAGGDNDYDVTVKVADAIGRSATLSVTVTVTNDNEAPMIDAGSDSFRVDENTATTTIVQTYEASDTDTDAASNLTWRLGGTDAGAFSITRNSQGHGELRFRNVPDYEHPDDIPLVAVLGGDNVYDITVTVADGRGESATLPVTVTVNDLNETPVVSGNNSPDFPEIEFDVDGASLTRADLTVPGTYTFADEDDRDVRWGLSGADAEHFTITKNANGNGVLTFKNPSPNKSVKPADYENPVNMGSNNVYRVVITADDRQNESNSVGTFTVDVTVTPVDETPEITTTGATHATPSFAEIESDATTADLTVADYDARDEERETITWSLGGADAGDFTINRNSGVLSFDARPNFEMPVDGSTPPDNVYNIIVEATDASPTRNIREFPVAVTVTNVDETPEITSPPSDRSYAEIEYDSDSTATDIPIVATFSARDEEMQDITWDLSGEDEGDFTITKDPNTGNGVITFDIPPNFEVPDDDDLRNTYQFTVLATDTASRTNTGAWDYAVTVTDVNERPEFTGTPETSFTLDEHDANEVYTTTPLASYSARDEEGRVTWSLTGPDSGDFAIDGAGVVTFAAAPSFETPNGDNIYTFTVVATDVQSRSARLTATVDVTVTVEDIEEAGTIEVDNLNPAVGDLITFVLTDPDGDIDVSAGGGFRWEIQERSPGGAWETIPASTLRSTTTGYRADEDDAGSEIRAVAHYGDRRGPLKSAESMATAAVAADPITNAPPRFQTGGTQRIPEVGAGVDVGERLTASDRDNDPLTWGISGGPGAAFFEIDASSGQLRTLQALDFETTVLPRPFVVQVTLRDGKDADGNTDRAVDVTTSIEVLLIDVEEHGVVMLSPEEPAIGTAVRATLEDGDGSIQGVSWRWARSENGRTGWVNISRARSSSYTPGADDGSHYLRASVDYTDRRGSGKSAEGITTAPVPRENRHPTFPSSEDGRRTVPENTPARVNIGTPVAAEDPEDDRLTYTLRGQDAAAFSVVASSGRLRTSEPLDFETQPSYSFTIEVRDGLDDSGNTSTMVDDSQSVTITTENVEEPGAVALTTLTGAIQARVEVTAELSDDDGPSDVTWQWSRSPNGATNWVNIANTTSATYTPTLEEDAGNYIRATATYTDGHGPNKTASTVSPLVGDPPPANSSPAFPATEDGQREAPEDTAAGEAFGDPVVANDLNDDDLTYSLSGTDAALFEIDTNSGQLRVAANAQLDFEGKPNLRVVVSVSDSADQNHDPDMVIDDKINVVITVTDVNEAPVVTGDTSLYFRENASTAVATFTGADPEGDTLTWSVDGSDFWISSSGQLYFSRPPSFESQPTHRVTVEATDDEGLSDTLAVTVTMTDMEEEGVVTITPPRGWADPATQFSAELSDDDGGVTNITWRWARSPNGRSGWVDIAGATSSSYTAGADDVGTYLRATAFYEDRRGSNKTAQSAPTGRIEDLRPATNSAPAFEDVTVTRSIGQGTAAGRAIGAPVTATDPDQGDILTYSLTGIDAEAFEIDAATGQIRTKAVLDPEVKDIHTVTVSVHDGFDARHNRSDAEDDSTDVTITVTEVSTPIFGGGGGGGGGGPSGPTPSDIEFEWNVERDIESLAAGHNRTTGMWSDGVTLWLGHNGDGADDAVYAYDLESGERVEEREFELDETNRAPRGVASDGVTMWIADSGRDTLFAHDLAGGERLAGQDVALHRDNAAPRGIWSDGVTMWVLDGGDDALFAYDLASGELLAEYALHDDNDDPRGLYFDGVTFWVSNHDPKRIFAYRLPMLEGGQDESVGEEAEAAELQELERIRDEEFTLLSRAGNNSPRGIWSDGDVMYVADESDDRVYSYNMPDAIDARLASLALSGVEIGEFSPGRREYEGSVAEGVTETVVTAEAMQRRTTVVIDPPDADGDEANGDQVALAGVAEITVTVTSTDGSRMRVYRVALGDPEREATPEPWTHCLRGDIAEGFSLVLYEGGSVEELEDCAQGRHVTALYATQDGVFVPDILGAPEFVNRSFRELYAGGVAPVTLLLAKSDGPATAGPGSSSPPGDGGPRPWPHCLRGATAAGFTLVLYEGGGVEDLAACAQGLGVTALYALDDGAFVPHILGAPEFVNRDFRELFAGGLPAVTPLLARSEGPPAGAADQDDAAGS